MTTERDILGRVADALTKAEIPYMLTGSIASSYYGTPRGTQDVDLVIEADAARIRRLHAEFPAEAYYFDLEAALRSCQAGSMFNVLEIQSVWKVDMIFRKSRAYDFTAFQRRAVREIGGIELFMISPEDLVIAKLEWAKAGSSERQLQDVAGVYEIRHSRLDATYLQHWVSELGLQQQWESMLRMIG